MLSKLLKIAILETRLKKLYILVEKKLSYDHFRGGGKKSELLMMGGTCPPRPLLGFGPVMRAGGMLCALTVSKISLENVRPTSLILV